MAKPEGIIKFSGTIDDFSIYKSKYGWIMRKKGGPDPRQMKKKKSFERVRENGKEFGACGRAAGWVRRGLASLIKESGDLKVTGRLTKLMMQVKELDTGSVRGKRNVYEGLKTQEGIELLKGFEFNEAAPVSLLLKTSYTVNSATGRIGLKDLDPKKELKAPKGATHVALKSIVLRVNFKTGAFEAQQSEPKRLAIQTGSYNVVLKPGNLNLQEGTNLCLLQVCFYQNTNGKEYQLKNADFNGMSVVGVE